MKKKFYVSASIAVIGSFLLSLIVSIIYFAVSMKIDDGTTLKVFLGYLTDFFNAASMFIGFGTIIYAFYRFDFFDGIMSLLIFFAGFLPYFLYQSITWNIYAENQSGTTIEGIDAFKSAIMGVYYSMGSGIINQVLPSILIGFVAYQMLKKKNGDPTRFISWSNRFQKTLIVCCLTLFGVNTVMYLLTGMLPDLLSVNFIFSSTAQLGNFFLLDVLFPLIENIIIYIVFDYVVFMLVYMLYNRILNEKVID